MVDRLKKSLDDLTVPECATCRVEMKWYRSEIAADGADVVRHYFYCASCGGFSERRSIIAKDDQLPPGGKINRPWRRAA